VLEGLYDAVEWLGLVDAEAVMSGLSRQYHYPYATAERRRSGSHYTPRALTEPIVAEALRPWLERCNGKPTAEQVLALKLCDPAMGSGAFLVALCRFLARALVAAWEDPAGPGFPPEFKKEWDKDLYARRLIA
jgi:type I restriction-modification system DNA methylase subunit